MSIIHGDESPIKDRWTKCVVCGQPTSQPPVCWDLRCEYELESRDQLSETSDNEGGYVDQHFHECHGCSEMVLCASVDRSEDCTPSPCLSCNR